MTLPHFDFNSTNPEDLPEGVSMPSQLGEVLQDQSESKYNAQSAERFPPNLGGTLAGGPLGSGVTGIVNKMAGKLTSRIATSDPADVRSKDDLVPMVPGFFDLPLQDLFAPLLNALNGVGGGVLGGALSGIADLFSARWGQVDSLADGQEALNERADLLSALEDFGAVYAPGSGGILNTGKIPFNQQIGPMKGCHRASNGIVLDEPGLWKIDCRSAFSFTISPGGGEVAWQVRVVNDSTGAVFSTRVDQFNDMSSQTRQMSFPIVVPTAGYRVEAHVTTLIVGRALQGGPAWNGLSAHHISHSTEHQVGD